MPAIFLRGGGGRNNAFMELKSIKPAFLLRQEKTIKLGLVSQMSICLDRHDEKLAAGRLLDECSHIASATGYHGSLKPITTSPPREGTNYDHKHMSS